MLILLPLWVLAVAAQTTDDGSKIYFENELPLFKTKASQAAEPQMVPQKVPQMIPQKVPQMVPQKTPQMVPQKTSQMVPQKVPQMVPQKSPQMVPQKVPQMAPPMPSMANDRNTCNRQYVAKGLREISINLDNLIRKYSQDENTLLSPIPIANAMGLLLLGAKGRTAQEISCLFGNNPDFDVSRSPDLLHKELGSLIDDLILQPGVSSGSEVSVGAAVFPNQWYGIKSSYIEKAATIYHSDIVPLDYIYRGSEAKTIINKWVANATNNRIKTILDRTPLPTTSIVLVSAIYFNCEWKHTFPLTNTKMKPFYTGKFTKNGEEEYVHVQMMLNSAEALYMEDKTRQLQVLGLPYKGDEIVMYIVLPEGDLKQALNQLREADFKEMINSCKSRQTIYMIPKMKLEAQLQLETLLPELGVTSLFDQTISDLDGIAPRAYVNEIIHKVEIEITETGTVASAATAATINRGNFIPVVRADKPFLFFIHHVKTDSFLFWGTVMKPTPYTSPKG
ncbi:serpin B8 [Nilaparvata lugens]|uniref:serpin B8 n=1 Tax=Nilaparvata lugens TaxID=108931 RepID=UPI00193CF707|nr:serpin B8 [Nilaparvata lugens]